MFSTSYYLYFTILLLTNTQYEMPKYYNHKHRPKNKTEEDENNYHLPLFLLPEMLFI